MTSMNLEAMDLFKSHQLTDEEEEECLMEREMVDKDITFHPYPSSSSNNNSCSISPLSSSSKAFFSSNHHHQEDSDQNDQDIIIHHLPPSHLHHLDLKTIGSSECCVVDEMRLTIYQLFSLFDINLSSHGDSLTTLSHEEELILDEDLGSD